MSESEVDYLVNADLSRCAGKWVALLNKKVIAFGETFKEVAETVDKKYPHKKPLLSRIPEKMAQIL